MVDFTRNFGHFYFAVLSHGMFYCSVGGNVMFSDRNYPFHQSGFLVLVSPFPSEKNI